MNYTALIKAINSANTQLQSRAAAAVNQARVLCNWLVGAIRGSLTRELPNSADSVNRIEEAVFSGSKLKPIRGTLSPEFPTTHSLKELIAIDDPWKRAFFENQCLIPCS